LAEPLDHDRIDRDLKSIGDQLRRLHEQLGRRKPVADQDVAEHDGEHAVEMNPLTPPEAES
jgi:hypothetical protein